MKKSNSSPFSCWTPALTGFGLAGFLWSHLVTAQARPLVTITANASTLLRTDISRATFGAGLEHQTPQFRDLMAQAPTATNARTAIQNASIAALRFPQGTTGLFYFWDAPSASFVSVSGVAQSQVLTPAEIYSYTASLGMDRLFEVNTFQYRKNGSTKYINVNGSSSASAAVINTANLLEGAQYAADWVTNNLNVQSASARVNFWEVGNEDWAWWTPEQYSQIFNAYAAKMKLANPDIKLLAQTITTPYTGVGGIVNDNTWTNRIVSSGIDSNGVYAVSYHKYLNGGTFQTPTDIEGQRVLQTMNMFADVQNATDLIDLKTRIANLGVPWKIWATEFNISQRNSSGGAMICQDLGHALVIADWVGRMLELNIERMDMHSLDHNPYYSIVDYVNNGGTIDNAITSVPGYAYSFYPQKFGAKMVSVTTAGNPTLSSPNRGNLPQVSTYASIVETPGNRRLRLMVIYRSPDQDVQLKIQTLGATMKAAPATFQYSRLYSAKMSDSNVNNKDHVTWSAPASYTSNAWALENIVIPVHSANYFDIPLQD